MQICGVAASLEIPNDTSRPFLRKEGQRQGRDKARDDCQQADIGDDLRQLPDDRRHGCKQHKGEYELPCFIQTLRSK